jgi:hypothetical protein
LSWEELGKTQVKIDPSQNDVQLSGSNVELETKITDAGIAVPIDLHYHQLSDTEALPVRKVGNNVLLATSSKLVVGAGETVTAFINSIDVSDYVYLYINVIPDTANAFEVYTRWFKPNGVSVFLNTLIHTASSTDNFSITPFRPMSERMNIRIKNTGASEATIENVCLYGLKG